MSTFKHKHRTCHTGKYTQEKSEQKTSCSQRNFYRLLPTFWMFKPLIYCLEKTPPLITRPLFRCLRGGTARNFSGPASRHLLPAVFKPPVSLVSYANPAFHQTWLLILNDSGFHSLSLPAAALIKWLSACCMLVDVHRHISALCLPIKNDPHRILFQLLPTPQAIE